MPLIVWGPSLFVKHPVIDDQHRELVILMNELTDLIEAGRPRDEIDKVFKETLKFTKYHFACEEKLMVKSNYKHHKEHRALHYSLIEALNNFYSKYIRGEMPTVQLMEFLRDWVAKHILEEDVKLSRDIQDIRDLNFSVGYQSIPEEVMRNEDAERAAKAEDKK